MSLFELFERGGPVMWPILACSIIAVSIAVERWRELTRVERETDRTFEEIRKALAGRQVAQARRLAQNSPGPLGRIAEAGLRWYGRPRQEIREVLEETGSQQSAGLERYVPLLGTIAHLAPLLGLLGTVTGLIRCFQVIQENATLARPVNPGDLAGGIWEALITTVFGLCVAIPSYALYNYLVHKIQNIVHNLEAKATRLTALLSVEESPVEEVGAL
ncbi:MAG: MotA/TolQ/ExbB proton channel family protein [Candidatus Omnitrophica bacterium]|nr:MotA/TolQ/ExbB proton channel family protein [Candidatus Omnitrophota bacterium]